MEISVNTVVEFFLSLFLNLGSEVISAMSFVLKMCY